MPGEDDRARTALLYLSESSQRGGGGGGRCGGSTHFPLLNISVAPKKGSLLMFESTDEEGACDTRSTHRSQALELVDEVTGERCWPGGKQVLQKWYAGKPRGRRGWRRTSAMPEHLRPVLSGGTQFIHCDIVSCRRYVPFKAMTAN